MGGVGVQQNVYSKVRYSGNTWKHDTLRSLIKINSSFTFPLWIDVPVYTQQHIIEQIKSCKKYNV